MKGIDMSDHPICSECKSEVTLIDGLCVSCKIRSLEKKIEANSVWREGEPGRGCITADKPII